MVLSLLLGHIQLHGLQQPEQVAIGCERTQGDVDVTIAALLKNPFLNTDPDLARPAPADLITSMPWLTSDEESRAMPTPDPSPPLMPIPAPVPSPKTTVTPAANSQAELEKQEPEPSAEEQPLDTMESKPQEPAAKKLLENSWLRVQLQPDIKSPTDSWSRWG